MSVDIEYTNQALWDPFAQTEPHYVMTVSYLPMKEYKIQYGEDSPNGRARRNVHGIQKKTSPKNLMMQGKK